MRNVLIASCEFSGLCRDITSKVRQLRGGTQVSYYFGDQLERLCLQRDFSLSETSFLVLRLGPYSHQKDSAAYKTEMRLVAEAPRHRMLIGIICDASGKITAPFLTGDLLNHVTVVVTNGPIEGCSVPEVYPNAQMIDLSRPGEDVGRIAWYIAQQLPEIQSPGTESRVTRQPQMTASNASPTNYTD